VKKFCIVVNFFIWIVIKNYWCDIKSENVLMLIVIEKCKKVIAVLLFIVKKSQSRHNRACFNKWFNKI